MDLNLTKLLGSIYFEALRLMARANERRVGSVKIYWGTRIKTKTEIHPLVLLQMSLTSHDDAGA